MPVARPTDRLCRVIPAWAGNSATICAQALPSAGHPRVGGEQENSNIEWTDHTGSSPRGRGTVRAKCRSCQEIRVIPAWAGNRTLAAGSDLTTTGHPRVGGEQSHHGARQSLGLGSSPRGRGTVMSCELLKTRRRVIPAWAGNRRGRSLRALARSGHPRVGGEQSDMARVAEAERGSSPRGRGTGSEVLRPRQPDRVIPAWAGNSEHAQQRAGRGAGHPRVGGEQRQQSGTCCARGGSSPRGRGTVGRLGCPLACARVIPAWAGNRANGPWNDCASAGHPRVGGEQMIEPVIACKSPGSSPRGRGTARCPRGISPTRRVIPAWAGNSPLALSPAGAQAGHPRVGGEQVRQTLGSSRPPGSSPRGRGTVAPARARRIARRVIPAWAGNSHHSASQ